MQPILTSSLIPSTSLTTRFARQIIIVRCSRLFLCSMVCFHWKLDRRWMIHMHCHKVGE
jgi:hypothetical protein